MQGFISATGWLNKTAPSCINFGALFLMRQGISLTVHQDVLVSARKFDDAPGRRNGKAPVRNSRKAPVFWPLFFLIN